jgi:hypothetical protein
MATDADTATREQVARQLDPELAENLSKGQPSKDEIIVRHALTIMRLRATLEEIIVRDYEAASIARRALSEQAHENHP